MRNSEPVRATSRDLEFMELAIAQARTGADEGGLPIGAALVCDGEVLGVGRNRLVQFGSVIRHGETDCLDNVGKLAADVYASSTLYTTMSPCQMCAGAVLLHGIPRVVIGENRSWQSSEELLREHGVEVVVLDLDSCTAMMRDLIEHHPELWDWK
jgi:creatinine deaminase